MSSTDGRARAHSPSLSDVFEREVPAARVRVAAQENIYASGDTDDSMYFIESGQVKLYMSSAAGKDCVVAIYGPGEVFGESCFSDSPKRFESAAAMLPTVVRRVTRRDFLAEVQKADAEEVLMRHLAERMAERQTAVFDLVTMDAERRLMKVLLQLAEKLGTPDGEFLQVEQRLPQEELSQMVGTTRPRVTAFMQRFRKLGIIDTETRALRVHRQRALEHLEGDDQ